MASVFQHVSTKHNVPLGDFPNPQKFASIIKNWEIWKFPQLKPQQIIAIDEVLSTGIPRLLEKIELKDDTSPGSKLNWNPFSSEIGDYEDGMQGIGTNWVISQQQKEIYDEKFFKLEISDGKAPGSKVKQLMLQSGLSKPVLGKVWSLSDLDKDGLMNSEEFALCLFLLDEAKNGNALPDKLPDDYIPPSFRKKLLDQKKKNPFDIPNNNTTTNGNGTRKTNEQRTEVEKKTDNVNKKTDTNNPPPRSSSSKRDVLQNLKNQNGSDGNTSTSKVNVFNVKGNDTSSVNESQNETNEKLQKDDTTEVKNNSNNVAGNENEYEFGSYGAW